MGATGDRRLEEIVADLKHDLAKYVAWRSANYGPEQWDGPMTAEFVAALQADILHTRGERPAWEVWDEAVGGLRGKELPVELQAVAVEVDRLRQLEGALRRGDPGELAPHRGTIAEAQQAIRAQLARLHRRLREG